MEKTLKYSVFKEKIIKTNELLQLHLEKTREIEKIQKCYQLLKNKLSHSNEEIKKLKLKNEGLSHSLQEAQKHYLPLKEDHEQLKVQFSRLENESSKTINDLQINYQLANQQLEEYKTKLSQIEEEQVPVAKPKSPVKRKKRSISTQTDGVDCMNHKLKELSAENLRLVSETSNYKLKIYELKKQQQDLQWLQDDFVRLKQLESDLSRKQQEIIDLKMIHTKNEESKDKEIKRLTKENETVQKSKKKVELENEKLKNENCSYQIELSMVRDSGTKQNTEDVIRIEEQNKLLINENNKLKDTINANQLEISALLIRIRECNKTPTNEQIADIMLDMAPLPQLSPLKISEDENYVDDNTDVSPTLDIPHMNSLSPALELKEEHIKSSSGDFIISSYPNITKATTKNINVSRKTRIIKKKRKKVDILGALIALKKAKINFIIGSDLVIHSDRKSPHFLKPPVPTYIERKFVVPEKKKSKTFLSKLSCDLACCKNSHMLLKGVDEKNAPLLGFFEVKNEIRPKSYGCDDNSKNVDWPETIPFHRSMRKRKKLENAKHNNRAVKNQKCDSRNSPNMEEISESATESFVCDSEAFSESSNNTTVPLLRRIVPPKNCDIDLHRNRRKSGSNGSVINKAAQHSYATRNGPKIAIVDDSSSCNKNDGAISLAQSESVCIGANNGHKTDHIVAKLGETTKQKPIKTSFKRPVCRTRRSPRLIASTAQTELSELPENLQEEIRKCSPPRCPRSPSPSTETCVISKPKLIPLEKVQPNVERMATSKIEVLFEKLVNFSMEEEALNEVVREFAGQDPEYIAEAILERISKDYHDTPDNKYNPAPLMTETQRTMLGFMSKLEKTNTVGVYDSYLTLAEHRLLTCQNLQEIAPISRLYLAICKLHKNLHRMRKLCCDVFYFCGDFAVPFLFVVLTSWTEVLPHEADSKDMPLARVLVQLVYMKDCNKPGYNLMPLRDLLIKFYGYPTERWDSDQLFEELFNGHIRTTSKLSEFALLLFCKNHSEKWVYDKIEQYFKPIIDKIQAHNTRAGVIIMIGNIYSRFSSKSEVNYLPKIRQWFTSLITETTPDVVKCSVYLCLNRLMNK